MSQGLAPSCRAGDLISRRQFASFASTTMDANFWSESNAGSNQRSETTLRPPACALRLKLSRSQPQQKLFSRQAEDIVAFEALFSSVN